MRKVAAKIRWSLENHFYENAVLLSERLVSKELSWENLFYLAESHYRSGKVRVAFEILQTSKYFRTLNRRVPSGVGEIEYKEKCMFILCSAAYALKRHKVLLDTADYAINRLGAEIGVDRKKYHHLLAKMYRDSGNHRKAVDYFRMVVEEDPDMLDAVLALADLDREFLGGQGQSATLESEESESDDLFIDDDDDDMFMYTPKPKARRRVGGRQDRTLDLYSGRKKAEQLLYKKTDAVGVPGIGGESLLSRHVIAASASRERPKELIEKLAPADEIQDPMELEVLGKAYLDIGDYTKAVSCFRRLSADFSYRTSGMDHYSAALWQIGDQVALSTLARRVMSLDDRSVSSLCVAANFLSSLGRHKEAIEILNRAVKVQSKPTPSVYSLIAYEYLEAEDYAAAEKYLIESINADERYWNGHYGLGTLYQRMGNLDKSEMYLKRALLLNPESSKLSTKLGITLSMLGKTSEAVKYLRIALDLDNKNYLASLNLAKIQITMGEFHEARRILQDLLYREGEEAIIFFYLGKLEAQEGNIQAAYDFYFRAFDHNPKEYAFLMKEIKKYAEIIFQQEREEMSPSEEEE